ncbi:unnamed protein product [Nippostrongylus brasiliensis]|uniref:Recombinase n=1 Tax=Nippostrongylus brasiliensis TaxID=27835 RepID=A0A0N4YU60_NIPBR|nr:unnamed protein product [Nippostrongylus brasiliensis]
MFTPVVSATDTEKAQFVDFVNNWSSEKMAGVTNMDEVFAMIQKEAPAIYAKAQQFREEHNSRKAKLNSAAKEWFQKNLFSIAFFTNLSRFYLEHIRFQWEKKYFEAIGSGDYKVVMKKMVQLGAQLFSEFKALPEDVVQNIKNAFPDQAWEECERSEVKPITGAPEKKTDN